MKKTVILSTIMLIILSLITNVYAESSCTVISSANKSEANKNDEIVAIFSISEIEDEIGIFMIGASLKYDRNVLKLEKIEPLGGWAGLFYNELNGNFVMDGDYTKQPGNIVKATFKVIGKTEQKTSISLINMSASNGIEDIKINSNTPISLNIKPVVVEKPVEGDKPKPVEPPVEEPKPEEKPTPEEKPATETKPNGTTNTETKPNEGNNANLNNTTDTEKPIQNLIVGSNKTETNSKNKPNNKTNMVDEPKKNEASEVLGTTTENPSDDESAKNELSTAENNEPILQPIENHETMEDSNEAFIVIGIVTAVIILAEIIFFTRKIVAKKKQIRENSEEMEYYDDTLEINNESYDGYGIGASVSYATQIKNDNYTIPTPTGYANFRYMPEMRNGNTSMQNYYSKMMQSNDNKMI